MEPEINIVAGWDNSQDLATRLEDAVDFFHHFPGFRHLAEEAG